MLFPFCSPGLSHKKWPHYNELIHIINSEHKNLGIGIAPGPNEIDEATKIKATLVLNELKPLNIMELAGLIKKSIFAFGRRSFIFLIIGGKETESPIPLTFNNKIFWNKLISDKSFRPLLIYFS